MSSSTRRDDGRISPVCADGTAEERVAYEERVADRLAISVPQLLAAEDAPPGALPDAPQTERKWKVEPHERVGALVDQFAELTRVRRLHDPASGRGGKR